MLHVTLSFLPSSRTRTRSRDVGACSGCGADAHFRRLVQKWNKCGYCFSASRAACGVRAGGDWGEWDWGAKAGPLGDPDWWEGGGDYPPHGGPAKVPTWLWFFREGKAGLDGRDGRIGDTGEKGDCGGQGEKGEKGEKGGMGDLGDDGDMGEKVNLANYHYHHYLCCALQYYATNAHDIQCNAGRF